MLIILAKSLAEQYTSCSACKLALTQWIVANPMETNPDAIADARDEIYQRCTPCTLEYLIWDVSCSIKEIQRLMKEVKDEN